MTFKTVWTKNSDNQNPPKRSEIKKGSAVWVIEKKNYGTVGRVQWFVE